MTTTKSKRRNGNRNVNQPTRLASGRIQRFIQPKVHRFWRSTAPSLLLAGATDTSYSLSPTLADAGSSTDFTSLFEQYRIKTIRVVFTCTTFNTASDAPFPRLYVAPDYNDNSIDSLTSIVQREGVITHEFTPTNPSITVEIDPKVAVAVYRGAINGFMSVPSGWLDVTYSDVPHYGLKYHIENYNTTSSSTRRIWRTIQFELETRYVI